MRRAIGSDSDLGYFKIPGFWSESKNTFFPLVEVASAYGMNLFNKDLLFEWNDKKQDLNYSVSLTSAIIQEEDKLVYTYKSLRSKTWVDKSNYVLIIDELNRCNVPTVLGDLLFAISNLEDWNIQTPVLTKHSGTCLIVPSNLSILCTLNNTDKNIDELDQALLRRFELVHLAPDYPAIDKKTEVWQNWFGKTTNPSTWLRNLNSDICKITESDEFQIGHSYFFRILNAIEGNGWDKNKLDDFTQALHLAVVTVYQGILPAIRNVMRSNGLDFKNAISSSFSWELTFDDSGGNFIPDFKPEVADVLRMKSTDLNLKEVKSVLNNISGLFMFDTENIVEQLKEVN